MQLRDRRGVAREARAQPFARIRSIPLSGKGVNYTGVTSITEETVVVHRKWEHDMKEWEAFDPKALEALEAEQRGDGIRSDIDGLTSVR